MTATATSLETRLKELEDIESIRSLKRQYAQHCDNNYNPTKIAQLFTEDGVWDGGAFGVHQGRAAIHEFFANITQQISFSLHYIANHQVDVDPSGLAATGHCYLWGTHTIGGRATFVGITFDERYRKVDGRWLFTLMKLNIHYMTPYEAGWVEQPMFS
jgi:hypothetical protein